MIQLGQSVSPGGPTRASEANSAFGSIDGLHDYSDNEHWFDPTTGDGKHKAVNILTKDAAAASIKDLVTLQWDPISGASQDGHGVGLRVLLDNDAGEPIRYFYWEFLAGDASDGTEDVELLLKGFIAGADTNILGFVNGAWNFQGLDILNIGNLSIGSGTWDDPWVLAGGLMYLWVHDIPAGAMWLMFKVSSAPVGATKNLVKDNATGYFSQSDPALAPVPDA